MTTLGIISDAWHFGRNAVVGLCLAACIGTAGAAPRTVAVVSLIGDKLEIVVPQVAVGSHLDRSRRAALADESGVFDKFTLQAAALAIAAVDLGIGTVLIGVPPSALHDRPERLFDGNHVALPGAIVDELERTAAGYLLLITKHRSDVRVPFASEYVGTGKVRGLGFFSDPQTRVKLIDSGETAAGFLAPFAYFLLSLVDVRSGLVVRERSVTLMQTLPAAAFRHGIDPWDLLDTRQKVERLQQLVRQGLAENVGPLLRGL